MQKAKGGCKAHNMLNKKPQASFEHKSPNPIDPASEKEVKLFCDSEGWQYTVSAHGRQCVPQET